MARRCRALARDRGRSLGRTEGDRSRSRTGASGLPIELPAAVHSLGVEIRVSKVRTAFVGLDDNHVGRRGREIVAIDPRKPALFAGESAGSYRLRASFRCVNGVPVRSSNYGRIIITFRATFCGGPNLKWRKIMTYVHGAMLAGIAAVAMSVPATAALVTSTPTRVVQPTVVQYAQDFKHGMRESNAYKSTKKKSAKKKTGTSGQASSPNTNPPK